VATTKQDVSKVRVRLSYTGTDGLFEGIEGKKVELLCDVCGDVINEPAPGIALTETSVNLPQDSDVQFVHKGKCDPDSGQWTDVQPMLDLLARTM